MAALPEDLWRGREVEAPSLLFISGSEMREPPSQIGTMSKRLERRFFFPVLLCLRKNFCAWLATCVGVLVVT